MTMQRAYEGLEPGKSIRHIALHEQNSPSCSVFHEQVADLEIGKEPVCIVTAFGPNDQVVQSCFDPKNPTAVIVKTIQNFPLEYPNDGKPFSYVTKNPKALGLNPYLHEEKPVEVAPPATDCKCEPQLE